jgi:outer membrane protein assembly factor BamD
MKNIIFISFIFFLSSCTAHQRALKDHKGTYLESAKVNFEAGEVMLKKEEYDKAMAYFQFVRSKYPFSKYAAFSDLKIADTKYAQKKWLDAASAYEIFIRLHPRHSEVCYASFRLGSSYFNAVPKSSWFWPKPASRDQSFTKEALSAVEDHIYQCTDSAYAEEARMIKAKLFSQLAQNYIYIAAYYERRKHFKAAATRYESVNELYPEAQESSEALFKAASIYNYKLHDHDHARILYNQIIEQKNDNNYPPKALKELEKLNL